MACGVGDRVAVEPIIRDNDCPNCLAGHYNLCPQLGFHGLSGYGGGLAEFSVVPGYMVHVLPDNVPTDAAALIEPLAVGWHAAKMADLRDGDSVLIIGAGPIGLVTLLAVKLMGAGDVVVVELSSARKAKAAELGADLVLDPAHDDVAEALAERFGQGVDVAFDAGGNAATIALALSSVRPKGRVVNIALWEHPVEFDMFSMLFKESNLTASCAYCNDHGEVIDALASGRIDVTPLITGRITFEEIVTRRHRGADRQPRRARQDPRPPLSADVTQRSQPVRRSRVPPAVAPSRYVFCSSSGSSFSARAEPEYWIRPPSST